MAHKQTHRDWLTETRPIANSLLEKAIDTRLQIAHRAKSCSGNADACSSKSDFDFIKARVAADSN